MAEAALDRVNEKDEKEPRSEKKKLKRLCNEDEESPETLKKTCRREPSAGSQDGSAPSVCEDGEEAEPYGMPTGIKSEASSSKGPGKEGQRDTPIAPRLDDCAKEAMEAVLGNQSKEISPEVLQQNREEIAKRQQPPRAQPHAAPPAHGASGVAHIVAVPMPLLPAGTPGPARLATYQILFENRLVHQRLAVSQMVPQRRSPFQTDIKEMEVTVYRDMSRRQEVHLAVPLIRGELKSDLAVYKEILMRREYTAGTSPMLRALFGIHAGDKIFDGGGNFGAFLFYAADAGVVEGITYEPSQSCLDVLSVNLETLRQYGANFQHSQEALGGQAGQATFEDHTRCGICGGSARSFVIMNEGQRHGRCTGSNFVTSSAIQVSSFYDELTDEHSIVKMDVEYSEMDIILNSPQDVPLDGLWKGVRVLMIEISLVALRKSYQPRGQGWRVLAEVFDKLMGAGFELAHVPSYVFQMRSWDPDAPVQKNHQDPILHLLRPVRGHWPEEDMQGEYYRAISNTRVMQLYLKWKCFQHIMRNGGE